MKGISCRILGHEALSDIGINDFSYGRCRL